MQNTCFKKCIERFNDSGTLSYLFLILSADSTIHSIFRPFCWRKQVPGSLCIQGLPHFAASSLVCHTSFFSQWTVHGGPANGEHQVANSGTAAQWHEHVNAEGSIAFHFKTVYVHNCRASLSLCLCKSQHSRRTAGTAAAAAPNGIEIPKRCHACDARVRDG